MSLTPGTYNFTIYQGTDVSKSFSGFPLDLSTCAAIQIDIRVGPGKPLILAFDLAHGLAFGGDGNTTLTWSMTAAESLTLPTTYPVQYDLRLTDAAGREAVYLAGTIKTTPRVTTGATP